MANRMKRRSVMLGLGALAAGSGATFVSGAFDSATTAPGADLRVISDGQVRIRGTDDDGDVYDLDGEDDSDDEIDFEDLDRDDYPRATFADAPDDSDDDTGNFNDDIDLTVAIELREDDSFSPLLKVDNDSQVDQEIIIHYEDEEGEQYGEDVGDGDDDVARSTVQQIYQFESGEKLISPDPGKDEDGEVPDTGSDVDIEPENTGANWVEVESGQTIDIDLSYDTEGDIVGEINSAARSGGDRFGDSAGTDVDLLDGIVIEARDSQE